MFIYHDPDEWEGVFESKTYGRDPFGHTLGSCSWGLRRRDPAAVAKIKEAKRIEHEEAVLAEAAAIIARRKSE